MAIYTGAGLTIDRCQHSWIELLAALLRRVAVSEEAITTLFSLYAPDQVASIAFQKLQDRYPDSWQSKVEGSIDTLLYEGGSWMSGRASRDLARLAKALADEAGHLTVVTTNYDTFYELELRNQLANPVVVVVADESTASNTKLSEEIYSSNSTLPDLTYVHGIIPDRQHEYKLERPPTIILDERRYIAFADILHSTLSGSIRERPLLVYGSSLIDRPLLRALAETSESGKKRFALVPNSGVHLTDYDQVLEQYRTPSDAG